MIKTKNIITTKNTEKIIVSDISEKEGFVSFVFLVV